MARQKNAYIFAPERQKRRGPGCLALVLSIVFAAVVLALLTNAATNNKLELQTEKVRVMSLDKAYEGFAILHISDLHSSDLAMDADRWKSMLFGKTFNAVVMTGDMVGKTDDYPMLVSLIKILQDINQSAPIYVVAGDEDPAPTIATQHGNANVLADWVLAVQEAGAVYLDAPVSQQTAKKGVVWFVPEYLYDVDVPGMQSSLTRQKEDMEAQGKQYEGEGGASYRALCYRLDQMDRTLAAIKAMTATDVQIAVTHVPPDIDYVRNMLQWNIDNASAFNFRSLSLVLAGHYCGGQWRLGALGPIYVPELGWFCGDTNIVGMQRVNSINLYISGGIAASTFYPMPGRAFNTPSVTLLSFTAKIE